MSTPIPSDAPRVLELYSGIGGCAAALEASESFSGGVGDRDAPTVVAAIDQSPRARDAYAANFAHPVQDRLVEGMRARDLAAFDADLWWLSPPCQPYTRRGLRRDDEDPRARSLLHLLEVLRELGSAAPRWLALENVPLFATSRSHRRLRQTLADLGYAMEEGLLCPSALGWPVRRQRFFLVASREHPPLPFPSAAATVTPIPSLAAFVDEAADERRDLVLSEATRRAYGHALSVVRRSDPDAIATCFTAAYGRSPVHSGSYLETSHGLRRFAPDEILRLLGFPERYHLPSMPLEGAYKLVGNSLSVPCAALVLSRLLLP